MARLLVCACVALAALAAVAPAQAKLRPGECEVCIKAVESMAKDAEGIKEVAKIEDSLVKSCKKLQHPQEKRFCYYIGGNKDSATRMLKAVAEPLSYGMPAEKVCEKLKKADYQICELSYPKDKAEILSDPVDLSKQRVKVLKAILADWGEECVGCTAKEDYLRRIEEVRAFHGAPKIDQEL